MGGQFRVKDGDGIICSLGSMDSSICVPVCHVDRIAGKNGATVNDCKAGVNILPFGVCQQPPTPKPCVPVILSPWLMGDSTVKVNGEATLLSTGILSCACGGIIRIKQ